MSTRLYFSNIDVTDSASYQPTVSYWAYTGGAASKFKLFHNSNNDIEQEKLSFHPLGTGNDVNKRMINTTFICETSLSGQTISGSFSGVFISKGASLHNSGHVDSFLVKVLSSTGLRGIIGSGDGTVKYISTGYQAIYFNTSLLPLIVVSGDRLCVEVGSKILHSGTHNTTSSSPRMKFINKSGVLDIPTNFLQFESERFYWGNGTYNNWVQFSRTVHFL